MAAEGPARSLQEEVTCSVCPDCAADPGTLGCGNSRCQACTGQPGGEPEPHVLCPQCRAAAPQRPVRPKRQLGEVLEPGKRESRAHAAHTVVPMEEAAQDYREKIQSCLEHLKDQREELQSLKCTWEQESERLLVGAWCKDGSGGSQGAEAPLAHPAGRAEHRDCEEEGGKCHSPVQRDCPPQHPDRTHQASLTLFCREDEAPMCAVCSESRAHAAHTVVPMEEAAQDYREKIQSCLEHLKDQREELQSLKCTWEQESERLLRQTELERQLVVSECEELRQLLAEQKRLLLTRLEELNTEIVRRREENATRLCKETARLSTLITELEEKCHQLGPEHLQGVRSAVTRGEEVTPLHPAPKFPEQKRIQNFCGEKKLQEAQTGFLVDVTLDPDTANPNLVLSEDRKCVRHGDTRQDLPDNPERFDPCVFVLGSQRFTGGRHYWEVEVGDKTDWALGVCRESVRKKGQVTFTPGNGYWTVWLWDGAYKALTSPTAPFPVRVQPRQVGVFLDYEAGEVSFYNVTDRSHLFTFTDTFSGTLRPLFCPGINAGGTNAAPLTLCSVPTQP
ncbi:E3 ubiquitin-protein ligase TRIM39-like [Alligator sinensis]|uniref:E3 ubiquitin-protein ligase TRIM39-like n=1 Tax=Alligator sinensis TaxID=38654 RepID=A0A3Q0HGW7_ALLSI|nr:E3 ubiquitin-protein ligase TRIM39-like [Alligator sinensis]